MRSKASRIVAVADPEPALLATLLAELRAIGFDVRRAIHSTAVVEADGRRFKITVMEQR